MDPLYRDLISFHGHSCPGLAIGYRMTKAALAFLSGSRSEDEELVAIVENNACGVDALQYLFLVPNAEGGHHKGGTATAGHGRVTDRVIRGRATGVLWSVVFRQTSAANAE